MGFADRIRGQAAYDYSADEARFRAAEPAANPDGFQVLLVKPTQFEQAQKIADYLSAGHLLFLNFDGTPREVSRRVLDYLSGAAYARGCGVERIAENAYLIRSLDAVAYQDGEDIPYDGEYGFDREFWSSTR